MSLTIRAGRARAIIRPECGGTVDALYLSPGGTGESISLLRGDAPEQADAPESPADGCEPGLFRGRLLAPFNDRIPGGRYTFRGESHSLPVNDEEFGDAIHGFLYRRRMEVVSKREGELHLVARTVPGEEAGYPFDLEISVSYRLEEDRFCLDLTGRNLGRSPLPLALGWHPYFQLPGLDRIDSAELKLPTERYVEVDRELLPTGELPPVADSPYDFRERAPIGTGELDLAFLLNPRGGNPSVAELYGPDHRLFLRTAGAGFLQLFIPPDRESVAIEPVTAATNAFNRPELGPIALEAGGRMTLSVAVSVRRRR